MPPKKRAQCLICNDKESKYTCSSCLVEYCSVACYKRHKEISCASCSKMEPKNSTPEPSGGDHPQRSHVPNDGDEIKTLRPLTSLKWPYVPEESAYPDPLKRDDPKPLQTRQYEAIATSPAVRAALENPGLQELLRSIDRLRGPAREEALQASLGVGRDAKNAEQIYSIVGGTRIGEEEQKAMRDLAEATEAAVRGNGEAMLGLDWGD